MIKEGKLVFVPSQVVLQKYMLMELKHIRKMIVIMLVVQEQSILMPMMMINQLVLLVIGKIFVYIKE